MVNGNGTKIRGLFTLPHSPNFWIRYAGPDGRMHRESTGTPNKALALKILSKRRTEVAEDKFLDKKRLTQMAFRQLCDRYLEWSETSVSHRTHERYVGLAENLCKVLGSEMAVNITRVDVEKYRVRRRREVSGSTVNREVGCLRAVYNKAILWDLLEKNPAANIDMFPERPRVRFLREDEQRRLLEACKRSDQRLLYPIVALAMLTGLRRGELLALEWRHIDLQRKILTVEHGKGDKSRIVPLCPQAVLVIEQMSREGEDKRLFPTNSIKKSFTTALKRSGITDFRFHDLRHCFASSLAAQGTDLLSIRDLLGHSTIEMSLRYAHLSNAKLRDAVNGLPDVLPQTAPTHAPASVSSRHTAI